MKKKFLAAVMSLVMLLGLIPNIAFAWNDDYPYSGGAIDAVDTWKFYTRECTSFVAWRLNSRNGVAFTNYYGGVQWGDAGNWGYAAQRIGITVDKNPAVGAVAWWDWGHVAWVEEVSGSDVTIEEYNYNPYIYGERPISASNPTGYIHIKDLSTGQTAGKPTIKSNVTNMKETDSAIVSWNATDYTDHYDYYLTEYPQGYAYTTNTTHGNTTNTSIFFGNLTSGEYSCFIHAISHQGGWSEQSNWVTFKVYADDYIPTKTVVSNNHIYALYDYEMSWSFARDLCKDLGGNLVTITSAEENQIVSDLINSGSKDAYWLGATDIDGTDKDFKWVTGETFSYSNWAAGEPNSSGENGEKEHFAEIRKSYNKQWNDVNNIYKSDKGFILEIDMSDISPTATETYNGNQYLLFDRNTTWTEAKVLCEQLGGHLVTLDSADENEFVKSFLENGERDWYYLGGQKNNGSWQWYDGRTADYIPWADNAKEWTGTNLMMYKSNGNCIGINNAYYPENDIEHIGFICEIEQEPELPVITDITTDVTTKGLSLVNATELTFTNLTARNISTDVIYVYKYPDGNIANIKLQSTTIPAKGNIDVNDTVITKITELNNKFINNVDVYVWDSVSGMKPLAEKTIGYFEYDY